MSNIIEFPQKPDGSGYLLDDEGKICGIFNGALGVAIDGDSVHVGWFFDDSIENPVELTTNEMNKFCIMWLAINDPSALSGGDE